MEAAAEAEDPPAAAEATDSEYDPAQIPESGHTAAGICFLKSLF